MARSAEMIENENSLNAVDFAHCMDTDARLSNIFANLGSFTEAANTSLEPWDVNRASIYLKFLGGWWWLLLGRPWAWSRFPCWVCILQSSGHAGYGEFQCIVPLLIGTFQDINPHFPYSSWILITLYGRSRHVEDFFLLEVPNFLMVVPLGFSWLHSACNTSCEDLPTLSLFQHHLLNLCHVRPSDTLQFNNSNGNKGECVSLGNFLMN